MLKNIYPFFLFGQKKHHDAIMQHLENHDQYHQLLTKHGWKLNLKASMIDQGQISYTKATSPSNPWIVREDKHWYHISKTGDIVKYGRDVQTLERHLNNIRPVNK